MKRDNTKAEIVKKITVAARAFKEKLVGKSFLYIFEGRTVEVIYRAKDFMHLTGVDTNMSGEQFFKDAVRGKLQANQIFFSQRHPYDLCAKKMSQLANLSLVIDSEVVVLENITTDTFTYRFGVTDLVFTIGLSEVTDKNGEAVGNCYFARTLRIDDSFSKSANALEVNFILSKPNSQQLYSTVTYSDPRFNLSDLPESVLILIEPSLYKPDNNI